MEAYETKRYDLTPVEESDMEWAASIMENPQSSLDSVRDALVLLKKLSEKGSLEAAELLGYSYGEGRNHLSQNPDKCKLHMERAANLGSTFAMDYLAWNYLKGECGFKKDGFKAHCLYHKLHNMEPDNNEYTIYYALGVFNGYPVDVDDDSCNISGITLQAVDKVMDASFYKTGNRGLALAMIKDLADKGDVLAKAMMKSVLSHISAESTAKVILNALFNLLPH